MIDVKFGFSQATDQLNSVQSIEWILGVQVICLFSCLVC
jgi:hypothetical protein